MSKISIPRAIQAIIDAVNAGDAEAFVALFAEDAILKDRGKELIGRDRVRAWVVAEVIEASARMRLVEAGTTGPITHLVFDWMLRGQTGRGEAFFTMHGGLISELRIPPE